MKFLIMLSLLLGLSGASVRSESLADFGFGPAALPPSRPVLLLLADYAASPPLPVKGTDAQWQRYVFGAAPLWSLKSYLEENSSGRYTITPASPAPLRLQMAFGDTRANIKAANPTWAAIDESNSETAAITTEWLSRIVKKALDSGFDFAPFDTNRNGVVETPRELTILIVQPLTEGSNQGSNRGISPQSNPAHTLTVQGSVPVVSHSISFPTLAHELGHSMGLNYEMYSQPRNEKDVFIADTNAGMTVMAQTNYGTTGVTNYDDPVLFKPGSVHFDPYHKTRFGWSQPRLVDIRRGGLFQIPVASTGVADAPLLLYDSTRPESLRHHEYFLLEYRARTRATRHYDGNFADEEVARRGVAEGLAIWQMQTQPDYSVSINFQPTDALLQPPADFLNFINKVIAKDPTATYPQADHLNPPSGLYAYTSSIVCRCPPDLNLVMNRPWTSGSTTPVLRWFDGTSTSTTVRVLPFPTGATAITVEILASYDTWVDFNGTSQPVPDGSFAKPFTSLAEGLAQVGYGGRLRIKPGTTAAGISNVTKRMTISAEGGAVRLGQP